MPTKIEWTDETWPVVTGCTACSIGCTNCYAARMAATRLRDHPRYAGLATFSDGKAKWTGEVRLNYDVLEQPLHWKKPRRVFVCSMSDLFHESIDEDFLIDVFVRMGEAHQHTFQILTKRPAKMYDFISRSTWGMSPLSNVHLGVSVENQAAADERREYLRQCPAAVKFVSYEPALGPVDWTGWEFVDQIISGGESGPGARPSHPDWHRATRDFCQANDIAYFFKQWGAYLGIDYLGAPSPVGAWGKPAWFRADGLYTRIGKKPDVDFGDGHGAVRIGKNRAGHLLDGKEWQEFPAGAGVDI